MGFGQPRLSHDFGWGQRNFFSFSIDHADAVRNAGIYNEAPANDAWGRVCETSVFLQTDDVDSAAEHVSASGGDDGIHPRGSSHTAHSAPLSGH